MALRAAPVVVMEAISLKLDEPVEVREEAGRILIEPIRPKAYNLNDLIKGRMQCVVLSSKRGRSFPWARCSAYLSSSGSIFTLDR
jgi:hypothetical protein